MNAWDFAHSTSRIGGRIQRNAGGISVPPADAMSPKHVYLVEETKDGVSEPLVEVVKLGLDERDNIVVVVKKRPRPRLRYEVLLGTLGIVIGAASVVAGVILP